MTAGGFAILRTGLALLAVVIGAAAVWIIAAEVLRPPLPYFPTDTRQAEMFSKARSRAGAAAGVGLARGDLSTAVALTEAAPLLFNAAGRSTSAVSRGDIAAARDAADRAARLAPHDARNWLLLASLDSLSADGGKNAIEALRLSYYTGSNEFALAPLRLRVAAAMTLDDDLQGFVRLEIDRILLQRPVLKPAIADAFKSASPATRPLLEGMLKQADPAFLATLTASPPR